MQQHSKIDCCALGCGIPAHLEAILITVLQETIQQDRLDLALAAELQAALLPKQCPTDCPHQVAAARNRMCGAVGGDFYDFIRINEDQIAIVIGDVVGHGVRAALMMAQIMGYLRSRPPDISRPAPVVAAVNRMLIDLGGRIESVTPCSMLYGVIDAPSGIGFFVNAGHPAPMLCQGGNCKALGAGDRNILLGIEDFQPKHTCLTFTPGQRLVLYTDGLLEAVNTNQEHFGQERLHQVITRHVDTSPETCAEAVFEAVQHFRQGAMQTDDETIIVIDRV